MEKEKEKGKEKRKENGEEKGKVKGKIKIKRKRKKRKYLIPMAIKAWMQTVFDLKSTNVSFWAKSRWCFWLLNEWSSISPITDNKLKKEKKSTGVCLSYLGDALFAF